MMLTKESRAVILQEEVDTIRVGEDEVGLIATAGFLRQDEVRAFHGLQASLQEQEAAEADLDVARNFNRAIKEAGQVIDAVITLEPHRRIDEVLGKERTAHLHMPEIRETVEAAHQAYQSTLWEAYENYMRNNGDYYDAAREIATADLLERGLPPLDSGVIIDAY